MGRAWLGDNLCCTWHGRMNLVLFGCQRDWFGRPPSVSLKCLVSWRDCVQLSSSLFPCRLLHHDSQTFYMVALCPKRTKQKLSVLFMAGPRVFCYFGYTLSPDQNSPSQSYLQEKRTATMLQCRVSENMWSYVISHNDSHTIL